VFTVVFTVCLLCVYCVFTVSSYNRLGYCLIVLD
jgi:hypothetical protein